MGLSLVFWIVVSGNICPNIVWYRDDGPDGGGGVPIETCGRWEIGYSAEWTNDEGTIFATRTVPSLSDLVFAWGRNATGEEVRDGVLAIVNTELRFDSETSENYLPSSVTLNSVTAVTADRLSFFETNDIEPSVIGGCSIPDGFPGSVTVPAPWQSRTYTVKVTAEIIEGVLTVKNADTEAVIDTIEGDIIEFELRCTGDDPPEDP